MTRIEDVSFRPVQPEDGETISTLFASAFGHEWTEGTWDYKYQRVPGSALGLSRVGVLGERVISHCGAMPRRLNMLGKTMSGAIIGDGMVDPQHRLRGLGAATLLACTDAVRDSGAAAWIGMPNEQSLLAWQRVACRVALLDKLYLPIEGQGHQALRARFDALDPDARWGYTVDFDYQLGEHYDRLWQSCARKESLSFCKDRAYLKWKYVDNPHSESRLVALRLGDDLYALAVVRFEKKTAVIMELFGYEKHIQNTQELVLALADHCREEGYEALKFFGKDPFFFQGVLRDFESRPFFGHHVMVRACNPEQAFLYENALNWTVTLGDCDSR